MLEMLDNASMHEQEHNEMLVFSLILGLKILIDRR